MYSVAFLPTKPEISIEETLAAIELTDKSKPLPHQQLQPSLLGPVLVSGGNDKRICIWDLSITSSRPDKDHLGASRSLVAQFQHSDKVNSCEVFVYEFYVLTRSSENVIYQAMEIFAGQENQYWWW